MSTISRSSSSLIVNRRFTKSCHLALGCIVSLDVPECTCTVHYNGLSHAKKIQTTTQCGKLGGPGVQQEVFIVFRQLYPMSYIFWLKV